jgi:hypothetical protein
MPSTWRKRFAELEKSIGEGKMVIRAEVDQPYALVQHENLEYAHPRGGRAKYLQAPLFENNREFMQILAFYFINAKGCELQTGAIRVAERISDLVEQNAPRLDHILRYSTRPQVIDNGQTVYNRAPKKERRRDKPNETNA